MTNPDKPEKPETRGSEPVSEPADITAAYPTSGAGEELVRVLDQYLANLEAGRAPPRDKLLADHPGLASQLEPCLSGMEFIHRAARPAADAPARLGDFEIVGEVGRGGMGVVYEARQISLKRKVALKVLRFAGVANRDAMERFQREAETVAQLHHTNIVPIFAIGEQQGVFYYVMQFIEGRSLAAVLEQSQKEAAPLDLVEAARWTLQAAEALAHAHQRSVIHRDVKPSNLILDPAGQVWLTDFGLAKRIDDMTLSMTGALLGTPRYMSPEQASAAKQPVDQRTDIYSLGATLYELATGKPLFEAESAHGIISQILTTEPPPPRKVRTGLPRDLETIILKCLAKEASARYPTAQALADDLRAFCEGRAIKARRAGLPERAARWVRKNRRMVSVAATAAAVSVLLVAGGIVISSLYHQSQLAHVTLKTEGPNLVAEVLEADQDRAVLPSFTVPTAEPVALLAGSYRVRVSAPGRAAETSQLLVDSGIGPYLTVGLKQQLLWDPISLNGNDTARLVNLKPGGWHVIRSQDVNTLSLLNASSAQSVWQWSSTGDLAGRSLAYDPDQDPPELVQPAPDLDGDGVGDLVWACRRFGRAMGHLRRGQSGQKREGVVVVFGGTRRNARPAGRGRHRRRWHGRLYCHLRGQGKRLDRGRVRKNGQVALEGAPRAAVVPERRALSLGAPDRSARRPPCRDLRGGKPPRGTRLEDRQVALAGGRPRHGIDRSPARGRSGPRRPARPAPRGPGTRGHAFRACLVAGDAETALDEDLAVRRVFLPVE